MLEEAVALKGQMCSVVFVSGTLVLIPFAVIMEGAQVWKEGPLSLSSLSLLLAVGVCAVVVDVVVVVGVVIVVVVVCCVLLLAGVPC